MDKYQKMLFEEPAKLFGWIVAGVISLSAFVVAILVNVVDVLPDSWKGKVNSTIATLVLVGLIATRVQAVLTRAKVYSPATVAGDPKLPALEGTQPGHTPQGGPQDEESGQSMLNELRKQLGVDNDGGN